MRLIKYFCRVRESRKEIFHCSRRCNPLNISSIIYKWPYFNATAACNYKTFTLYSQTSGIWVWLLGVWTKTWPIFWLSLCDIISGGRFVTGCSMPKCCHDCVTTDEVTTGFLVNCEMASMAQDLSHFSHLVWPNWPLCNNTTNREDSVCNAANLWYK